MDVVVVSALGSIPPDVSVPPRAAAVTPASLAAASWRTELNISGKGYLHSLDWYCGAGGVSSFYFRVTIDGGTPQMVGSHVTDLVFSNTYNAALPLGAIRFKTSLKVEIYNPGGASASIGSKVVYSLT